MKAFTLTAMLALVAVALSSPLAHAQENVHVLIATPDAVTTNSTNSTSKPIFLPGVGAPVGLDSAAGSAGEDEKESSPLMTVKAGSAEADKMITQPAPTGKKPESSNSSSATASTPAPTKSSATTAFVCASVAAATTAMSVALL